MELTDELIQGAIDSITGYIVSVVAEQQNKSIEEVMEKFIASKTYALLANKDTGLYWDSIAETIDLFLAEDNQS
jgi:pantothenate kinase type III